MHCDNSPSTLGRMTHRMRPFFMAAGLLLTLMLVGCSTGRSSAPDAASVPPDLSVKVYRHLEGSRHTYLVVNAKSELSFGGGRQAVLRTAAPVGPLTQAQMQEIWSIIVEHKLLDVKNQSSFSSGKHTTFDVQIKTDKGFSKKEFRVMDEQVPKGVRLLHDKLFEYQAQQRYRQVAPASTPHEKPASH